MCTRVCLACVRPQTNRQVQARGESSFCGQTATSSLSPAPLHPRAPARLTAALLLLQTMAVSRPLLSPECPSLHNGRFQPESGVRYKRGARVHAPPLSPQPSALSPNALNPRLWTPDPKPSASALRPKPQAPSSKPAAPSPTPCALSHYLYARQGVDSLSLGSLGRSSSRKLPILSGVDRQDSLTLDEVCACTLTPPNIARVFVPDVNPEPQPLFCRLQGLGVTADPSSRSCRASSARTASRWTRSEPAP